jgi:acetyl-CoA carboxylase biotin carboxylase subunit
MIAKLIVRARTRDLAIQKMLRSLDEFVIEGVKTTVPFHRQLLRNEKFRAGDFDTGFVDTFKLEPEKNEVS